MKADGISSAFVAPVPTEISYVPNDCPAPNASGQSVIKTWDGSEYLCENNTNYSAGDITGIIAYSLKDCADACATFSRFNGGCDSFTHDADLARSYTVNNGANCWLKNSRISDGKNVDYNGSSAKLIKKVAM
jgi:hypothetical protein